MTMEYSKNGDLFEVIKKTGKLEANFARFYFNQLLNVMEHLHLTVKVAHLDLKLENILVGDDYKLKLCDFGFTETLA